LPIQALSDAGYDFTLCEAGSVGCAVATRLSEDASARVLGGGSSVNGLVWACGHKTDYDRWADLAGEHARRYDAVVAIYRRIEDWKRPPNPRLRVADGSIMPEVTTGNTMAPCVVIGERCAGEVKAAYGMA